MSRGKGAKSKIKGRISGYETADFIIVSPIMQDLMQVQNLEKKFPVKTGKKKMPVLKKIIIALICIIVIPIASIIVIGVIVGIHDSISNSTYVEPKVLTPETADIKPSAFTQRQLDAEDARDKSIAKLLEDEWIMTDNAMPSDYYITVGKKWEAIRTNPSPMINVDTSYGYDQKDQKYETSAITVSLQEIKENSGIILDSTIANIFKIYSPSINMESVNSSVQAAYNSTLNSKPYEGSLTFDKDTVYIRGKKSGQLINITVQVNTYVTNE